MRNQKEEKNNIGFLILLILVSMLVLASYDSSSNRHREGDVVYRGNISEQLNTVLCKTVSLPDLQKFCQNTDYNKNPIAFSVTNKISYFNVRINQCFNQVQKTRLLIKPDLPHLFHFRFEPNDTDYPPHLS